MKSINERIIFKINYTVEVYLSSPLDAHFLPHFFRNKHCRWAPDQEQIFHPNAWELMRQPVIKLEYFRSPVTQLYRI